MLESDVRNTGDGQARPPHICTDVLGAGEAKALVKKEVGRPRGKEGRFRECFWIHQTRP